MSEANTPNNLPEEPSLSLNGEPLPEFITEEIQAKQPEFLKNNLDDTDPSPKNLAQETDWFTQIQKYRRRTRSLINKVAQLEQTLVETEKALESEAMRSRSAETFISQQAEEINSAHEQIAQISGELEFSNQTVQRQKIFIETLSEQVEASLERVAQLERECAQIQQHYNEKAYQLLQTENISQDLRSRLGRQERQVRQFKAALNKCIDVTAHNSRFKVSPSSKLSEQKESPSPSKAQPIQPLIEASITVSESDSGEVSSTSESPSEKPIEAEKDQQLRQAPRILQPGSKNKENLKEEREHERLISLPSPQPLSTLHCLTPPSPKSSLSLKDQRSPVFPKREISSDPIAKLNSSKATDKDEANSPTPAPQSKTQPKLKLPQFPRYLP